MCSDEYLQSKGLMTLRKKVSENTVGKGKNAGNQPFLLLPPVFSN